MHIKAIANIEDFYNIFSWNFAILYIDVKLKVAIKGYWFFYDGEFF